jgi:hypothetical protein
MFLLLSLLACSEDFGADDTGLTPVTRPEDTDGPPDSADSVDSGDDPGPDTDSADSGPDDTGDTAPPDTTPVTLYMAEDGDDTASGASDAPLASLQGVHDRLVALDTHGTVDVRIRAGTYYCRGMVDWWTFHNGAHIRIGPDGDVSSPAADHADDPDRPVFEGRDETDTNCDDSVWLQVRHAGVETPMTIEGLFVTRYRGAISIKADDAVTSDPDLGITIDNMAFQRVGDKYHYRERSDGTYLEGKGAILLTQASGCSVTDSWFDNIRNVEESAGLVHAIYFTSQASRHLVQGNTFHGCTGAMIKLSDYSNGNRFLDNQISYAPHGLRDRWCGASEDPEGECEEGEAQCPSWENYYPYERNTWGNIDAEDPVTVVRIPDGQTCAFDPPASNIRMDLGEGGVIEGP